MKCIYCSNDSKYSERTDGKCPRCAKKFAFEPKTGDTITDPAFNAAIERVSSGGTVKWTPRHLYYEVARRLQRRSRAAPWILGGLSLVTLVIALVGPSALLILTVIFALFAYANRPRKTIKLTEAEFDTMWSKWRSAHGNPKGLIVRKDAAPTSASARALPPDIHHYSFDRAVVVDRPETVDLLLANNFHFENNCAVLSVGGYPPQAFDTVVGMLKQNPKLSVYALHDGSIDGCLLAGKLRAVGWFQDTARIVDVGLRPEHAGPFEGCWQASADALPPVPELSAHDSAWLRRYSVELSVIRPEQIIKRLFRAISNPAAVLAGTDDGTVFVDSSSFGSDASASDGGGDSFG